MTNIDEYNRLNDSTKQILIKWFMATGEAITALRIEGYEATEAVTFLRRILFGKNIKYLDY